ncbi:MAG: hypothetical protein M1838_003726 [Thelocarpon superellum]|nr:MAG: hypothetical protein M1838_003726 [Thelocarpon superellum]
MSAPSGPAVFRPGAVALITGGASGIGYAVAQLCARHGMHVALVDHNGPALADAAKNVKSEPAEATNASVPVEATEPQVVPCEVDVSKTEAWTTLKEQVVHRFGGVDFLMLNAGVARGGPWEDVSQWHDVISTNLFGVINGIAAFLPVLKGRGPSPTSIVITGSKQGITNPPGAPAYNASKAAVKSLAEHLSYDLRGTSTSVHLLIPGWTFTNMTRRGPDATKPAGAWTAAEVAGYLYGKMRESQFYVLCPDNETTAEKDKKRVLWSAGDLVQGRPPLSRWREEWKDKAEEGIENIELTTQ